jgi:hypothetical protein
VTCAQLPLPSSFPAALGYKAASFFSKSLTKARLPRASMVWPSASRRLRTASSPPGYFGLSSPFTLSVYLPGCRNQHFAIAPLSSSLAFERKHAGQVLVVRQFFRPGFLRFCSHA